MTPNIDLSFIETARAEHRDFLLEPEGYALLEAVGLGVPRHFVVREAKALDASVLESIPTSEVVLKVVSADVLHKSDVGGVKIVVRELEAVRDGIDAILTAVSAAVPSARIHGVMIAEKIPFRADAPGTELLISARNDAAFGPVLAMGPGGVLTEWYGKLSEGRSHSLVGLSNFDAAATTQRLADTAFGRQALRPSRLFKTPPFTSEALASALDGLSRLIAITDNSGDLALEEIELNPVVAVDGRPVALDALIRIAPPATALRRPRPISTIASLLHPKSAAVYGASANSMNAGRIILNNLKQAKGLDFGKLWAVHPKAERIDGVYCVSSTALLPEVVDLAVVSVPAERAPEVIEAIAETANARSIILIPGGFAETGEGGRAERIQTALASSRDREDGGPVLVGGNCLGIVSKRSYNTFFLPSYKLPFHDAPGDSLMVVSQSGAYLVSFTSNLDGIIFPSASVSYGNEMDLTASDFLEYALEHEPGVEVFAFYIEGFHPGEGARFLRLVRQARNEGKSIVVYKAGKTDVGAKAAASHTASIAGDYQVVRSLLLEAGAAVCETLNMFEDFTKVFTMLRGRRGGGNRVGVITNAGFEAGAISDQLYGLELAQFSDATRKKLESVLPVIAHCGNPIDCTPMTDTEHFVKAVEIMAEADEVDVLVVSAIPATPALDVLAPDPEGAHAENAFSLRSLPAELARVFAEIDKPLVGAIDSGRLYDPGVLMLERAGVPVFRKIDRASRALSAFVAHER